MSMSLSVEFNKSGFQGDPNIPDDDGCFIAGAMPYIAYRLDRMIEDRDLLPLQHFIFSGDMLCEEEWAEAGHAKPEKEWFDPADGLRTIGHLIELLRKRDPEEQLDCCTVDDAIYELEVLQTLLEIA